MRDAEMAYGSSEKLEEIAISRAIEERELT
jgi:hypothetical protein